MSELENRPLISVLTVQKEVAERITAEPPKMNRLAASVRFWAEPKIIARLPKTDFYPIPGVDSAVIKLEARSLKREAEEEDYYKTVRALFAQPRKTILNNILAVKKLRREMLVEHLMKIGIPPESRPQNLNVEQIAKIGELLAA